MSIGTIIIIIAMLFVLGNVMSLKPKMSEVRVGNMRMVARKMELHPKLVAMPDWLKNHRQDGCDGQSTQALASHEMTAKYTIINDDWQLPAKRLLWTGGDWQNEDGASINLEIPPRSLLPHIQGLTTKANSISIYWQDEKYAKSFAIKDEQVMTMIEQDLLALKLFLQNVHHANP